MFTLADIAEIVIVLGQVIFLYQPVLLFNRYMGYPALLTLIHFERAIPDDPLIGSLDDLYHIGRTNVRTRSAPDTIDRRFFQRCAYLF